MTHATKTHGRDPQFWSHLIIFLLVVICILLVREYFSRQLLVRRVDSYQMHAVLAITANIFLALFAYFLIKQNNLFRLAGLRSVELRKWYLLIFPLVYLVGINLVLMDDIKIGAPFSAFVLLLINCVSIGVSEELSMRGFLQSHLINRFGEQRLVACVFMSALLFGLIHLIKFDKGIYGEISQIAYATFIGVMFGSPKASQFVSLENAIFITLLGAPCLLYAMYLMKKFELSDIPAS